MFTKFHLAAFALFLTLCFAATRVHAQVPVSLDVDYAAPVDSGAVEEGFGGALRFGPQLDLAILKLTTELGLGLHDFAGPLGPTVFRGVIGPRLGLGVLIRPSVYGHLGVGHVNFDTSPDLTHVTFDLGAALDFAVVPGFELGAHGAYNFIFGDGSVGSFGFLVLGGHMTLVLGRDAGD